MVHINMDVDQPSWDTWAAENNISPETRAFLRFRPTLIHDIKARKIGPAFPSPRTWAYADEIAGQGHSTSDTLELLTGTVGEGAATEYLAFIKTAKELPSFQEIVLAPEKAKIPDSPAAKYAATAMLEVKASKDNLQQCMTYMSRMDVEFQAAFVHNIAANRSELSNTKEFVDWCVKNKAVIGVV